ncbi:class III lanthionine synthetase LanKC [Bacillus wiedmannii]|uniref:class III lanthionine synthetase LanKC n=1 Tax=Bacillus wiedmannii TaxID=1890302 RepID=UPI002E243A68|nr:class III lanthionine synthetase LanKC [Bacillus wiedmannii]
MDMRYLRYVIPNERYYELPKVKAEESKLNLPSLPELWETRSDGHWTYYLRPDVILPIQGWKIHISAASSEAQRTLDLVSAFLFEHSVTFKHVSNLWELILKNSKYGDRGSSGKFITIYPLDEEQFVFLLDSLHHILKDLKKGPYILSDKRWLDGNVYFRYGAFAEMYVEDGASKVLAIKTPSGEYIPDSRGASYVVPDFVEEPQLIQEMTKAQEETMLEESKLSNYNIKSALHFSNGGGVYLAEEINSGKEVVLKEGRPGAGLDGQSRDAVERLKHEAKILERLKGLECVVQYQEIFQEWEHIFVVEEYIPGSTLNTWLAAYYPFAKNQDSKEFCEKAVGILKQLKKAVEDIHSRGIGMGDLQPANVMVTTTNEVRLIDFESASDITDTKHSGLMTPGFTGSVKSNREQADWFALLRIVRNIFLPIGPVQDMAESILQTHDKWIFKHFGEEALKIIKEIEAECEKREAKPIDSILSSPKKYFDKNDLPQVISSLRKGIISDLREGDRLLPGDIRQYESTNGLINIQTGGFGIIMALARTGILPEKAREWALKFSSAEYIDDLDNGLFNGKAGIAGVLYEIGMITEAKKVYDSIPNQIDSEDVSLRTGLSGIGLSLLSASTLPGFESLFEKALGIGYQLEELLNRDVVIKPDDLDAIPIGLIDGWSGASLLFSSLYWITENNHWLNLSIRAIEKDTEQCVLEDTGVYQVRDNSRFVPYLAGGSAGIGLAMIELRHLLKNKDWHEELLAIGEMSASKCFYSPGLFRGLSGLIITANAIDVEFSLQDEESYVNTAIETMNLYLLEDEGKFFVPGDFNYRLSGDIFSGASGMLLALHEISSRGFSWLPIPEISKLFPSYNNPEGKKIILKGGDLNESSIISSNVSV